MWSHHTVATGTLLTALPGSCPSGGREGSWLSLRAWPSAFLCPQGLASGFSSSPCCLPLPSECAQMLTFLIPSQGACPGGAL